MYKREILDQELDDGMIVDNMDYLAEQVVGHRIVSAEQVDGTRGYCGGGRDLVITLDNGKRVRLIDTEDCCAYTQLDSFLLAPNSVDHMIMGVGSTDDYTTWHIYADMGDVLALNVDWSPGNPFYYGYGFTIEVEDVP
jgi:hypothetical protein